MQSKQGLHFCCAAVASLATAGLRDKNPSSSLVSFPEIATPTIRQITFWFLLQLVLICQPPTCSFSDYVLLSELPATDGFGGYMDISAGQDPTIFEDRHLKYISVLGKVRVVL